MKKWQAQIPVVQSIKTRKRCYVLWYIPRSFVNRTYFAGDTHLIIWMTDKQLTMFNMRFTDAVYEEVIERDSLEYFRKKYSNHTYENIPYE